MKDEINITPLEQPKDLAEEITKLYFIDHNLEEICSIPAFLSICQKMTDFTCSLIPFPYAVIEYIEGAREEFTDLSEVERVKLLSGLGAVLKVAHTITETGFGWINFHSDFAGDLSWGETIKKILIGRGRILVEMGIVTRESLSGLEMLSENRIPVLSKGSLLHGDLTMSNIIFIDRHIGGIIDPDPIVGDGLYDIAYFLTSSGNQTSPEHENIILTSYYDQQPDKESLIRLKFYKTLAMMRQISAAIKKRTRNNNTDLVIKEVRRTIEEISSL